MALFHASVWLNKTIVQCLGGGRLCCIGDRTTFCMSALPPCTRPLLLFLLPCLFLASWWCSFLCLTSPRSAGITDAAPICLFCGHQSWTVVRLVWQELLLPEPSCWPSNAYFWHICQKLVAAALRVISVFYSVALAYVSVFVLGPRCFRYHGSVV